MFFKRENTDLEIAATVLFYCYRPNSWAPFIGTVIERLRFIIITEQLQRRISDYRTASRVCNINTAMLSARSESIILSSSVIS